MDRVKALVAGIGFIITGIILSAAVPHLMPEVRQYAAQISHTNCLLLFSSQSIEGVVIPQLPQVCTAIQNWLPSSLIANGILLILFGLTFWDSLISILNLSIVALFFCNPWIDGSFTSFQNFLQVLICIGAFSVFILGQPQIEKEKTN